MRPGSDSKNDRCMAGGLVPREQVSLNMGSGACVEKTWKWAGQKLRCLLEAILPAGAQGREFHRESHGCASSHCSRTSTETSSTEGSGYSFHFHFSVIFLSLSALAKD